MNATDWILPSVYLGVLIPAALPLGRLMAVVLAGRRCRSSPCQPEDVSIRKCWLWVLLKSVWGPDAVHENQYLRVYMGTLRSKIEEDPARPRYLLTEPGIGYRLSDAAPS